MKRIRLYIILLSCFCLTAKAQNIPVPLTYSQIYDYLDELITDGVITAQTSVRPYTRRQVANMLVAAQNADSLLNKRQRADLAF